MSRHVVCHDYRSIPNTHVVFSSPPSPLNFFITLFVCLCEPLEQNTLFEHTFVSHIFMDFNQIHISYSPMYALPMKTTFSQKQALKCV